jgi:DNA-binding transcriptional regulator YdaS (Cro superfamily)
MTDLLSRAIEAAGGAAEFCSRVGISRRTLALWRRHGVPDTRCIAVEQACGGVVSAEELAAARVTKLRSMLHAEREGS